MRVFVMSLLTTMALVASIVFWADPAHRWHRRLTGLQAFAPDEVLVHSPDLDEREMKLLLLRVHEPPTLVVLGSSRVLSFDRSMFSRGERLLNLGLSGASAEDYVAFWRALEEQAKVPRTLMLFVDPWVFNKSRHQDRWITVHRLVRRFAEENGGPAGLPLSLRLDIVVRPTIAEVTELVSWAPLRASLAFAIKAARGRTIDRLGTVKPQASLAPGDVGMRWDGSHRYESAVYVEPSLPYIEARAREYATATSVYSIGSWAVDPAAVSLVAQLVSAVKRRHTELILVAPPYHPVTLAVLKTRPGYQSVIPDYLRILGGIAQAQSIRFCDAVDAARSGCTATEFIDGMHPLPACDRKILELCLGADPSSKLLAEP
jgi:hypothetical protein